QAIMDDSDFDVAVESLHSAGFRDAPWPYFFLEDPETTEDEDIRERQREVALQFKSLDEHSIRFQFPLGSGIKLRAVLVPSSYANLSFRDRLRSLVILSYRTRSGSLAITATLPMPQVFLSHLVA
ncbi:hypothetical protein C7999DRAFT_17493, partial [Corynascus novoguineensis]